MGTGKKLAVPDAAILNIAKPPGCTSRDIVNRVQRVVGRGVRVGHGGTLDPMATGVLLIAVGRATKLMPVVHEFCKSYSAKFTLGQCSDTDDSTGLISKNEVDEIPDLETIDRHLRNQIGEVMQTPPAYSAVKVAGQRAYEAARRGEKVSLKSRPVRIFEIAIVEYCYPELIVDIRCGSGTYIRSIARDLGDSLGTGGLMHALARQRIGPFTLANSISIDQWENHAVGDGDVRNYWNNVRILFDDWPQYQLSSDEIENLRHGRRIEIETLHHRLAAFSTGGDFVAILIRRDGNLFKTSVNWAPLIN